MYLGLKLNSYGCGQIAWYLQPYSGRMNFERDWLNFTP